MRNEQVVRLNDVFGAARELPLNYVERENVDAQLVDNLTRDKHIVIFGSSKQGKTSLRKHTLRPEDSILVQCSNKWSLADLHGSVLKQAGFQIVQSNKKTVSGKLKILASIKASFFGNEASGGLEAEGSRSVETTTKELELDPDDVNDIIRALTSIKFNKYIVLEDFHYLSADTQKDFSVALKAFHEASSFCFIIVGVWLEENRLIVFNGDLSGRVIAVNADRWNDEELHEVIDSGAAHMNVEFPDKFKNELIQESRRSVYIVQEVCRKACEEAGVLQSLEEKREIAGDFDVKNSVKDVINQQSARYLSFINSFSEGFQDTELKMYRWLLYPVLTSKEEDLEGGILYRDIRKKLQANHPQGGGLNAGNITQALNSAASLQASKGIKPIILDYDQTNKRLNVVDKAFITWLAYQNKKDLLEAAGLDV